MNVQDIKLDLINWLVNLKDEAIIHKIRSLKDGTSETDWYNTLSENEKRNIQKGLDDITNGRVVDHEQAMAKIKSKITSLKDS